MKERERVREKERGGKYLGNGQTRTFADNLICMLLVRLWTRMKELPYSL